MTIIKSYKHTSFRPPEVILQHETSYWRLIGGSAMTWQADWDDHIPRRYLRIHAIHGTHYETKRGRRDTVLNCTREFFIDVPEVRSYARQKLFEGFWQQDFVTLLMKELL